MTARQPRPSDVEPRDWRRLAVCVGVDPELFFPIETGEDGPARVQAAKQVCAGCPVRAVCLADVMAWEDPARRWGVVGGISAAERAALYARQRTTLAHLHPAVGPAEGGEAA